MENNLTPDRVTYSESRTINIGDYENVNSFLSYSTDVKRINKKLNLLEIRHSEAETLDENKEDFKSTVTRTVNRVKTILDMRETAIRKRVIENDFVVAYDPEAKMPKKGK